jgi:hypothetical protein
MSTVDPIIIYGASDDLVEVEGPISAEFDCYGKWAGKLTSPDGETLLVSVEYGRKEWEIAVYASSEDGFPSWPIQFTERPDRDSDPAVKIFAPAGTTIEETSN